MPDLRVAWWNLENLFDREGARGRDPGLAAQLASELRGWTAAIRDNKLDQLATIINGMFAGAGPDLLGVCEVENESVLQLLVNRLTAANRDYRVATHPSLDARGIDVSFVYDHRVLRVLALGHQQVIKRRATRDLFHVRFRVVQNDAEFTVVGNHWPSRTGGQYESEAYRMAVGETVSFFLSGIDRDFPVLLMGDFNDEPFNRAMQEYLLGTRDRDRLMGARNPMAQNLMWPLMATDNPGTYKFGSDWNMLDQFLANRGMLLQNSSVRVLPDTVQIERPAAMLGAGGSPRRFGRPSATLDPGGFSDHFPITVVLGSP